MMHRLVGFLIAALVASSAVAQGVKRDAPGVPEYLLFSSHRGSAIATNSDMGGGFNGTTRPVMITGISIYVNVASGGGAGNSTFRISDGVTNCDIVFLCTTTSGIGLWRTNSSCVFPAGASLKLSVSSSTCTTTQPSVMHAQVYGRHQ